MNPFLYTDDNKRYHTLAYHNRHMFGGKVYKAAIDAGMTCPNLDGKVGVGGCIFCDGGSRYFAAGPEVPVVEQIKQEIGRIRQTHKDASVIAYFQAHTNTYASLDQLQSLYESARNVEGVCGLSIATRADALPQDVVSYLAALSQKTYLTVELGLQTAKDETARRINRGHTFATFLSGYQRLKEQGIRICVHLINGLPGEEQKDMIDTAQRVAALAPDGLKIHLLHVLKHTKLAQWYQNGWYSPMTMEAYIHTVVKQLEYMPPQTVIERLTGDGDRRTLLAPLWSRDKIRVLGGIDQCQVHFDSYQGKMWEKMKKEKEP